MRYTGSVMCFDKDSLTYGDGFLLYRDTTPTYEGAPSAYNNSCLSYVDGPSAYTDTAKLYA